MHFQQKDFLQPGIHGCLNSLKRILQLGKLSVFKLFESWPNYYCMNKILWLELGDMEPAFDKKLASSVGVKCQCLYQRGHG